MFPSLVRELCTAFLRLRDSLTAVPGVWPIGELRSHYRISALSKRSCAQAAYLLSYRCLIDSMPHGIPPLFNSTQDFLLLRDSCYISIKGFSGCGAPVWEGRLEDEALCVPLIRPGMRSGVWVSCHMCPSSARPWTRWSKGRHSLLTLKQTGSDWRRSPRGRSGTAPIEITDNPCALRSLQLLQTPLVVIPRRLTIADRSPRTDAETPPLSPSGWPPLQH